jgi:hypothetical protein
MTESEEQRQQKMTLMMMRLQSSALRLINLFNLPDKLIVPVEKALMRKHEGMLPSITEKQKVWNYQYNEAQKWLKLKNN